MFKDTTLDYISTQPELAKQVVRGLESEVRRLQKQLGINTDADGVTGLIEEVETWLIEQKESNEILKKKMYDRSSERRPKGDAPASTEDKRSRQKPDNSGRQEVGVGLPIQEEIYTLPEETTCDCECASSMEPMSGQTETSTLVDYIPGKLVRRRILRMKYRGACGCLKTAPGPTTLVDGGQYGIDLAAEFVVRKFHDHLPWERQAKALERDGLRLAPTTMWNQTRHVALLLEDVYKAIRKNIVSGHLRHTDETRWRVIEGVENKTQYVWLFRNHHHAYFTIEDSRSGDVPKRILEGATGALIADDYAGYNAVTKDQHFNRVQCWSHTRRKFFEIQNTYPQVDVFLDLVSDLYKKDREFRNSKNQSPKYRRQLCRPIIMAIDTWRKNQHSLPKSAFRKALNYMADNWSGLIAFLKDPKLPLDNNPAEQALRQVVLGRKNFMFNRSMEGARITAMLYTICVSCAMNGVDPKTYIRETIIRIRNCRGFQLPHAFANQRENLNLA